MDNASLAAREFRLDPMYVRCGFYVTAAWILLGFVVIWVNGVRLNPPPGSEYLPIVFWTTSAAGLLPWHWRLRVDTSGIARRRFLRWDLWPWEDFAAERLKFGYGDRCFVDPARPFWRRKLSLETLTQADSDQVWKWISVVWQPAVTTVPEVLEVRVGNLLKRAVRYDHSGIELGRGTRLQRFEWNEVISLKVERLRHERTDFRQLTLELPNIKLVFFRNQQNGVEGRNWTGAEPDVITQYLLAHVPTDRQMTTASKDDPISQRELEVRLGRARDKVREFKRACLFCGAIVSTGMVGFAVAGEWPIVGILGFITSQYAAFFWFIYRTHRDSLHKLEALRFEADDALNKTRKPSALPPA